MKRIDKKTWPKYFQDILDGRKTFDVRLADFYCEVGDILVFKEWDPKKKDYTGRKIEKTIGYILKTKEDDFWPEEEVDEYGYVIFSLE